MPPALQQIAEIPWPTLILGPGGEVFGSASAVRLLGFEPRGVDGLEQRLEVTSSAGTSLSARALPWRRVQQGQRFEEVQLWRDRLSGVQQSLRVRGHALESWGLLDLDPEHAAPELRVHEQLFALNASLLAQASTQESISLRAVLLELVELACEMTGARYGALGILGRDGSSLKDFIYSGVSEETARVIGHLPTGRGLLGAVIREGKAIRVDCIARDPRAEGFPAGHPPMTTFVGMPLRLDTEVFGNFYLADKRSGEAFSDADELLLARFCTQAGLTVAFARQLQDEEQQLLEAVVEHAPYGLTYFPADPSLEPFGNGAAGRMLGRVTRAEDPDCSFVLRHVDGRPLTREEFPVGRALREGAVINVEVLVDRRDVVAPPRPALVSAAPVHSPKGVMLGVVVVLQDISARKELDRLREDFTAMVAHDLRTPLQAVLMQVEMLIRQAAGEAATVPVSTLHRMRANGHRLELLVRDLLDASRIEARQVVLDRQPVNLQTTVAALVQQIHAALGTHPVTVEVTGELPLVQADQLRCEQIVTNMLENAAKYSADGSPISVGLLVRDGGVEVSVGDRGRGIAPEEVEHLFDRYYQAQRARAARLGLGLGLFIARGLVEAHGGRITVESTPGVGSVFRVWLPAKEAGPT